MVLEENKAARAAPSVLPGGNGARGMEKGMLGWVHPPASLKTASPERGPAWLRVASPEQTSLSADLFSG